MLIRRFGLFDDMSSLFHGFDSLLHEIGEESVLPSARLTVTSQPAPALEGWRRGYPAVETFRRDGEFVIRAELPGVDPGEVQVTVDDDQLRLRGERKQEQTEDEPEFFVRETFRGRFERTFVLPRGIKAEQVEARHANGVLEITLPATPLEDASRKVPIQIEAGESRKIAS